MTTWEILGIDPTDDVSAIKRAYAKKLKIHHPEDDPDGFQKLREAYESAVKHARHMQDKHAQNVVTTDETDHISNDLHTPMHVNLMDRFTDRTPDIEDNDIHTPPHIDLMNGFADRTPSVEHNVDDFINQAKALYRNFFSRIDIENWKALLNSEVVWHVGYKEILNTKMIEFLQDHHHLPKNIWQLLESHFHWREKEEYLSTSLPKPFIDYIFRQLNQTWALRYCFFKEVEGVDYDAFIACRENAFYALIDNDLERAGYNIATAYSIYPDDPDLLGMQGEYYLRIGETDHALIAFNHVSSINPDDLDGYFYRAQLLYDKGEIPLAIADYTYIRSRIPEDLDALCFLAKCYMKLGDIDNAKEMFLQVLKQNPFDIEAQTYLAQISDQLKKQGRSSHLALKQIYKELGKPSIIDKTKVFLFVFLKRSWIYLIILSLLQFAVYTSFIEKIGKTPKDFAIEFIMMMKEPITIKNSKDLDKIPMKANLIQINFSNAGYLGLNRVSKKAHNGKITTVYLTRKEAEEQGLLDYITGYVCTGYLDDKAVILITNYEQAMQIYQGNSIHVKGKVYPMSSQDLSDIITQSVKGTSPYTKKYIDTKIDLSSYIKEVPLRIDFIALFIPLLYILILREIRRAARTVKY